MGVTRLGLISAMILTVSLHSGCSFLFVKGPPANHAEVASFECSESNAWPVVDMIWAGLNGLGAASAAGDDENPDQGQIVTVGVSWLVVSGISAIYGFSKVSACSDAKRLRDERYYPPRMAAPAPAPAPVSAGAAASGAAPAPTVPAAAPVQAAPAATPAPAASGTAPSLPVAPGSASPAPTTSPAPSTSPTPTTLPAPTTSLAPSRSILPVHLAVHALPSRSLAMRPALAVD